MKSKEEIIENIQEAIVNSGGIFIYQNKIKYMTVNELLNLILPNDIEVTIKYNRN